MYVCNTTGIFCECSTELGYCKVTACYKRNQLMNYKQGKIVNMIDEVKKGYYQRIVDDETLTTYYEIYDEDGNHVASCVCEEEFEDDTKPTLS